MNGNKPVVNSTNNNNLIQPNEEHSKFGLLAPPVNRNSFNFIREVSEDSVYIGDQNDDIEDEHSGEEDIKPSKRDKAIKMLVIFIIIVMMKKMMIMLIDYQISNQLNEGKNKVLQTMMMMMMMMTKKRKKILTIMMLKI